MVTGSLLHANARTTWTITLREISGYDDAGNNTLVENYSYTNGVAKGTKKEEYTFNSAKKKILTIKYKWSNNEWCYNIRTVTNYDASNNLIEEASYNWGNGDWVGSGARTLKTFNSSKKVTEQITQTWSTIDNDWVNRSRLTYAYSGTKTTQEATFSWTDNDWLGLTRKDYHYTASGLNDTTKTYTNNGTDWIYSNRTINTYNASGTNIMTHNSTWNGTRWELVSMTRTDAISDAAGHQLLYATWRCGSDSVWIGLQKDTTAYTASGNTIFSAHYEAWANNNWLPSYKIESIYDDGDRLTLTERKDWIENRWQGHYRYEYIYDANGRQISSAIYNSWSNATNNWVGTIKTETVYNNEGQPVAILNYIWRNNDWYALDNNLLMYDGSNNIIEQIIQNYSNDTWVNVSRYEKAYRGSLQIKSNDYTWENNVWLMTRRNEKEYDADSQAKLRREVSGTWSNGVVQSYSDKHYFYSCDAPADNNGAQPRTPTELEEIDENYDTNVQPFDPTQPTYNLSGQSVDPATYHGIVIQNGKKYVL